jgi:iron complex outermembrane receptor protein
MTQTNQKSRKAEKQRGFQVSPVAAGCAVLLISVASATHAQQASTELVVTGIRAAIENSIAKKRDADGVIEAISAEDIGKLPDNSIAESIARMPGLAAQRVNGRSQTISIRGLSGDFSGTLLNGREQVSVGDNRAVEFDQYPSELLSGVTVYKTPDASLIGQGLSGTVDMQTIRPLSVQKRTITVSARGESNSNGKLNPGSKSTTGRVSATLIDKSDDGKFGYAVGVAKLETPTQAQKFNAWGYTDTKQAGLKGTEQVLGGAEFKTYSGVGTRDALMGVLEFKPTKDYHATLDVYHSKFKESVTDRGLVFGTAWSSATLSNPVVNNGVLTGGTWNGVRPVLWQELQSRDDTVQSIGWNNKFNLGGGLKAQADLSWGKATRKESIIESYGGMPSGVTDSWTFNTNNGNGIPTGALGLNYADFSQIKMIDSGGWGQDGYAKYLNVTDELKAAKVSANYLLKNSAFSSVDFGLNYSERSKDKNVPESLLTLKNGSSSVPTSLQLGSTPLANGSSVAAWNIPAAYDSVYNFITKNHPDIYLKQWAVNETVTSGFAKLNIDSELGKTPVRGNVGFQVINTDQSSTALSVDTNSGTKGSGDNYGNTLQVTPFTQGKTYTDVLPSLNLAFEVDSDQTVRFGLGKQMARARLDQLRASRNAAVDLTTRTWSGGGGNPNLDPFRADALDISYEKYFGNKAYISAAAFRKNLKSYVYQQTVTDYDFTGATNSSSVTPISNIGKFTAPLNGKGGTLTGAELSASFPLSMASKALDGFGLAASYSYTESNIQPQGPGSSMPLPGLSKDVYGITAYYEKNGLSARIGSRHRSNFVGEIQGFGADRSLVYIASENLVDVQFGYDFPSVKGLSALVQINNATNAEYKQYTDNPSKPTAYSKYGRSVLMGLNYKF